jgi:Ca2+-binding RTX toxin-like protein
MRRRTVKLSALRRSSVLAAVVVAVAASPTATRAGDEVLRCHGQVATVVGTPGPDSFAEDAEATSEADIDFDSGDVIVARGGRDSIGVYSLSDVRACGNGGRDQMDALSGSGRDFVFDGGAGADWLGDASPSPAQGPVWTPLKLLGGTGNDSFVGGGKPDLIRGGAGKDSVYGYGGRDDLFGGPGDDEFGGGSGNDAMHGNPGDDRLKGDGGHDTAGGGAGRDHCEAEVKSGCES